MTKKVKIVFVIVIIIFAISLVLSLHMLRNTKNSRAVLVRDGVQLYSFNLSEDKKIRIDYEDSGYNIIEIKDGKIRICQADCPDQTCVKSGNLWSEDMPVVCLPHHLILKFEED